MLAEQSPWLRHWAQRPREVSQNGALAPQLDLLIEHGDIAKGQIPHVLSVDYADTFVTEQCLRLSRLNLD